MRRTIRLAVPLLLTLGLAGCAANWATVPPDNHGYWPEYIYVYADGCWADDRWFSPCLWAPGPYYGYYYYSAGDWWYHHGEIWPFIPGYPPPPAWRYRDPVNHHRFPGPPPRRNRPGPPRHGGPRHGPGHDPYDPSRGH